jgi:hypothetical protein
MPSPQTLEQFVAAVESNKHDKAIEAFYTENASIQENQSEPRRGRDTLVANEKTFMARAKSIESKCIRPVFQAGNFVVIRWKFRFVGKDDSVMEMEEIAYQRWEGEKIAEKQFFYDPKQREPK